MRGLALMAGGLSMCALLLAPTTASATVLMPTTITELVAGANTIVRGTVVGVESHWVEDRRGIETVVTLLPDRFLKGAPRPLMRMRMAGGVVGRIRHVVVGAPSVSVGDCVVLFLAQSGPRVPHPVGLSLGVARVELAADGRHEVRVPAGLSDSDARIGSSTGMAPRRVALSDFETRVEALVEAGR